MALNGIFLTSSGIGIGKFLDSLFGGAQDSQTTIRVAAALNGYQDIDAADGTVASIRTMNQNNDILGLSNSVSVDSGSYSDVGVSQPDTEQAAFVQLFADSDAICIAYVSTTWVDDTKWMWVGDWGEPCGLNWYYSGITAGTEDDGSGHLTYCTWLDSDGSVTRRGDVEKRDGTTAGSILIGVSEYGNQDLDGSDATTVCAAPMLQGFSDAEGTTKIFGRDADSPLPAQKKKRGVDPRVVISEAPSHNATYLCEHPTSHGPDFTSLAEGKHCDMESRQLTDLCDSATTTDCYDTKTHTVIGGKKRSAKSYAKIIEW